MATNIIPLSEAELVEYVYYRSPDMRGGFYKISIGFLNESIARISYTSCIAHNSKVKNSHKDISVAILKEIEKIFKASGMENWKNENFGDIFVCDGPNYSYFFKFDNGESFNFSSQMFMPPYSDVLQTIDEIIAKYDSKHMKLSK